MSLPRVVIEAGQPPSSAVLKGGQRGSRSAGPGPTGRCHTQQNAKTILANHAEEHCAPRPAEVCLVDQDRLSERGVKALRRPAPWSRRSCPREVACRPVSPFMWAAFSCRVWVLTEVLTTGRMSLDECGCAGGHGAGQEACGDTPGRR